MRENRKRFVDLMLKESWTTEEEKWLMKYLEGAETRELQALMQQLFRSDLAVMDDLDEVIETPEKVLKMIHDRAEIPVKEKRRTIAPVVRWALLSVASIVVILLGLSYLMSVNVRSLQDNSKEGDRIGNYKNDVDPGRDRAVLILDDGRSLILDEVSDGKLTNQDNVALMKSGEKIDYRLVDSAQSQHLFNTIRTPRGGQYQVELSDGTRVWLNAASSIRFPVSFQGRQERRVEVNGEVYFEVMDNKRVPFIVAAGDASIQVLGTHFNVKAYHDDPFLQTTLLEGSIRLYSKGSELLIEPEQQVRVSSAGLQLLDHVDVDEVTAWKNGYFEFNDSEFKEIARQLSRWYDVEVVCTREIEDLFYAKIPRNTKLSVVLSALEYTGKVRFQIEGDKIVVLP